jgi:hypothetical protein
MIIWSRGVGGVIYLVFFVLLWNRYITYFECPMMQDFLTSFNNLNDRQFQLSLDSVIDMWLSAGALVGSDNSYALSLVSVVFWIHWNDHNWAFFSHLTAPTFNALIMKISYLLYIWTGLQGSLEHLCRAEPNLPVQED